MASDGTYTLPRNRQEEVENEYLDLQAANTDDIAVNTNIGKVRFDNGHRSAGGPWVNQSKEAYSRTVENAQTQSLKEPLPRRTFYIFLIGGVLVFIVGLLMGILIGYFAIKINGHIESKRQKSENDSYKLGFVGSTMGMTVTTRNPFNTSATTEQIKSTMTTTTTSSPAAFTREAPGGLVCSCPTQPFVSSTTNAPCSVCERINPQTDIPDEKVQSIFAPLTKHETDKIIDKLIEDGIITKRSFLGANYINHIYVYPVEKALALEYLDNNGAFPYRYAKVHVTRGAAEQPDVMIYKVGPVNETIQNMTVDKLVPDGKIHFNRRSYDGKETGQMYNLIRKAMDSLQDVLRKSFDGATYGRGISVGRPALHSLEESDRRSGCYLYLHMTTGESTLRILPVSFIIHHPGTVTSKWFTSDFYYLNQGPFDSAIELAEAYRNGTLRKFRLPVNYRKDFDLEYDLLRNKSLPFRKFSELPPPRTYEPKGPRYRITENVITWMDWECEFSVHPFKGPALYNIKFKEQRIAYEISLQDITLVYASGTTGAGVDPPIISDTEFSLGAAIRPSRAGFGCPDRASYLRATVFNTRSYNQEVACVFEADTQRPLWRHGNNGLLDHHLIIRSPMNLGNYDYTLEFRFYLDGRIQTVIAASGTLYGSFWDSEDPLLNDDKSTSPFGFRIGNILSGPIHSHDFIFKVDLDILGTNNSFQRVNWKGGDVLTALKTQTNIKEKPGFFPFNITRYIETDFLEKEAGLVVDPLNPSYWTIVNENKKNKWGVTRGYRIIPSFADSEPDSFTKHLVFGPWLNMKYHCAITKRKDEEPYGTDSLYDLRRPTDPIGGLTNMMNEENIRNEDLVAWITAKFIHAPTSEDVPMTIGVDKGFFLKPFNYFDVTPTFDLPGHYDREDPYKKVQCYEP